MTQESKGQSPRRNALKVLMASGVVAATTVERNWVKPIVHSVMLPAHAQTSSDEKGGPNHRPLRDPCSVGVTCDDGGGVSVDANGRVENGDGISGTEIQVEFELDGSVQTETTITDSGGFWSSSVTFGDAPETGTVFVEASAPEFGSTNCQASYTCTDEKTSEEGVCVKIDGADIGRDNLQIDLGSETVTIMSWIQKDGEVGEYVGFTLDTNVCFDVKAGNGCFTDEGSSWTHPEGTSGPDAKAISNVTFCPSALCPSLGNCR